MHELIASPFMNEYDVRKALPRYLEENPHTIIALAYFDLYEPTSDSIEAIRPYLTNGSVLAFDELAHAKWPRRNRRLRDTLGIDHGNLHSLPGRATPAYLRWGGYPGSASDNRLDQQRVTVGQDELLTTRRASGRSTRWLWQRSCRANTARKS